MLDSTPWQGSGLISCVRSSASGADECVPSPLGSARRITYADDTATGRASSLIEGPLSALVLPIAGNAHSSASYAGAAAQNFIDEARAAVRDAIVGCSDTRHAIIFGGSGATWASNRLVSLLAPRAQEGPRCSFSGCGRMFSTASALLAHARRSHSDGEASAWAARSLRPVTNDDTSASSTGADGIVVVCGPFAHHSSFLPWRAAGATIELVESGDGGSCILSKFDAALRRRAAQSPRLLVALLSLGSNVTGATLPADVAAAMAHSHGGVAIFDAAAAAPHRQLVIDAGSSLSSSSIAKVLGKADWCGTVIEPSAGFSTAADALFFSPHKFVGGGAGAPGVLIVRRSLLSGREPAEPGGGTVSFVDRDGVPTFSGDDVAREEAGSPPVVGAARVGLLMRLAQSVGWSRIAAREESMAAVARATWSAHPCIRVLGESAVLGAPRLPIVSIAVNSPGGLLHWNFVAAVLNDIFGIQGRGGCLCAGPYSQDLLGMTAIESTALQARLAVEADELLRPGVVRVSFAYATSYSSFRYIVRAFLWIATHGAALLGWYAPDERTGEWRPHRAGLRGALTAGAEVDVTGRVGAAREVIKASTIDEANGLVLSDASRGAQRAQPRRWLSAVEFGDTGAKIPMVSLRADTRSVVSEATLFDAYLVEADALLVGLAKSDAPIVHASAGLLSAEGASLRWFALDDAPCAPWRLDETLHCIPADEVAADVARLSARVRNILGGDNAILPDISAWDGGVILESPTNSSSSETSSPTEEDRAKETCVNVVTAAKKVGKIFTLPRALSESAAATSAIAQSKEACGADDNDEDSDAGEDDWRVVRAATATFTAAARAEAALPPRLTPLEFAARRSRLAETAAALVAVTGAPPQALVRTLAHGLKEAISQYRMIRHGDRILVGLSGGKDSMTMLLQLLRLQAIAPIYFEIGAATVDPQYAGFDPSPLQAWTASIGVPFSFESLDVVSLAKEKMGADSLCAFCSRLKRGLLYSACRRRGYNVLALGQHLDDFAESFVMSAFKNGVLRTMKAHYTNDAGDIRIIRPLCLLREKATRAFADACALPVIAENCPACFTGPTARYLTKRLLAREEASNSALYPALLSAMRPLMTTRGSTQVLSAAATTISNQDLAIAPKGFVPAALGGEPTDGTVGGTV